MNDNLNTLYQVWHKEPQGYVHAFTVHGKDLLTALVLPMIEPRGDGVSAHLDAPRPTTFGDVIVTPQADAYRVSETRHGVVLDLVDFAQIKRDATVHALMREDFQMGQEQAAMGEFRESVRQLADILAAPSPAPDPPAREPEVER